ncbi:hypothetical protein [Aneurinibacillus sp. REN35]|uniref:hypothetical protein n=1 Tax=Aneurinibacillus sp. REN35 TaxID=3237286 RepID=UPI003529C174
MNRQAITSTLTQETETAVWQESGRIALMAARRTEYNVKGQWMRQPVMRSAGGERLLLMRSSIR